MTLQPIGFLRYGLYTEVSLEMPRVRMYVNPGPSQFELRAFSLTIDLVKIRFRVHMLFRRNQHLTSPAATRKELIKGHKVCD